MKTKILSLAVALFALAGQAQQFLNPGTSANAGDGTSLRAGALLINTNFFSIFARALNLDGATNGLTTADSNLQGATNGLNTRVSNLNGATNGLSTRASNLEGATNGLATRVAALESAPGGTNNLNLNAAFLNITNVEAFKIVDWGSVTNPVVDWLSTNAINYTPSNNFTITQTGTVPSGWYVKKTLRIVNTNSTAGYFFTNDMNFASVNLLSAPSTNFFILHNWGGIIWIASAQQPEIGTNAYMRTRTGVRRTIVVPAGYIKTNSVQGAIAGTDESASNRIARDYLDFDEAANTNANFSIPMSNAWDRNVVRVAVHWTCTNSASAGVVWKVSSTATQDGITNDGAFGARAGIADSAANAMYYRISPVSSDITPGNSPSGALNELSLRIERDYGNASDTMGGRIRLYYVVVEYNESTTEPAALP